MKRRDFAELISVGTLGMLMVPSIGCSMMSKSRSNGPKQIYLKSEKNSKMDLPHGKRVPFGWSAMGISPEESFLLKPEETVPKGNLLLRVSVAQEIWDKKLLHINIPEADIYLGAIDIRFSSVLVPYELKIESKYIPLINKYGLQLKLESSSSLWIFDNPDGNTNNLAFLPHLLVSKEESGKTSDFLDCFMSVNSIQAFGWREGTVLDGLWQIYDRKGEEKALKAIQQHLNLFFDVNKNLVYETSQSVPRDNRVDGIESTIPFATLTRLYPNHPIIGTVLDGWGSLTKENGMVTDGMQLSAEGCYTVAYPMAVIGKSRHSKDLMNKALEQLKHRFVLIHEGDFYLRATGSERTYKNWARGAAWFLLGFSRTIYELKDEIIDEEIVAKFREGVDMALSMQRQDGLWSCFMHKDVSPDTSGSAGISAAILTGIEQGILPESYRKQVDKCWVALQNYLTPDGFLKGVAQDNRGGISLQEGEYRVIAQMGMGMMAQLYAFLGQDES